MVYNTPLEWVFIPNSMEERRSLIAFCKTMVGKSHGLISPWYSHRVDVKIANMDLQAKGIVVKSRDLAVQIIMTYSPTPLTSS